MNIYLKCVVACLFLWVGTGKVFCQAEKSAAPSGGVGIIENIDSRLGKSKCDQITAQVALDQEQGTFEVQANTSICSVSVWSGNGNLAREWTPSSCYSLEGIPDGNYWIVVEHADCYSLIPLEFF